MHVSPSAPAPHHRCDGNRQGPASAPQPLSSNVVFMQSSSFASSSSFSANGVVVSSSTYTSSNTYFASSVVANDRVSIDNFKVFDDLLKRAYDQLASRTAVNYAAPVDEPLSAETVAGNILGFIEAQLRRDQAQGASVEELEERLNQGLAGFKKGFGEAKEQIEALGLLSPEIDEDISLTYDLVLDGIDDLRRQYVSGESDAVEDPVVADGDDQTSPNDSQTGNDDVVTDDVAANDTAPAPSVYQTRAAVVRSLSSFQSSTQVSNQANVHQINSFKAPQQVSAPAAESGDETVVAKPTVEQDRATPAAPSLSASYGHYSYAQLNSFSFELETADGDKVTINVRTRDMYSAEYRAGSFDNGDNQVSFEDFTNNVFSSSRFHLDIDGELDEEELAAIDQLLTQVEELSVDFFEGDVESAYNQALNLGYNAEEIVNFSLNLRQVEVERFTAAYQAVAPAENNGAQGLGQRLQPLGHFVKDLLDSVDTASRFGDGSRLVADVAEQMGEAYEHHPRGHHFGRFVRDLLDGAPRQ